jgi:hypothetical protein
MLPSYAVVTESIEGRTVRFEMIREPNIDGSSIVVVRAFFWSWSSPTWISLRGVGHMFADGFILAPDGTIEVAPDEEMWDFR